MMRMMIETMRKRRRTEDMTRMVVMLKMMRKRRRT